jgi:phage-related holin
MNIKRFIIITAAVALIVSLGYGYGNSIVLPEGTDSIAGIITEVNSKETYIRIDTQLYYFADASVMDTMLKIRNISRYEKVIVYYKKERGKYLIVNIEKFKQKDFY